MTNVGEASPRSWHGSFYRVRGSLRHEADSGGDEELREWISIERTTGGALPHLMIVNAYSYSSHHDIHPTQSTSHSSPPLPPSIPPTTMFPLPLPITRPLPHPLHKLRHDPLNRLPHPLIHLPIHRNRITNMKPPGDNLHRDLLRTLQRAAGAELVRAHRRRAPGVVIAVDVDEARRVVDVPAARVGVDLGFCAAGRDAVGFAVWACGGRDVSQWMGLIKIPIFVRRLRVLGSSTHLQESTAHTAGSSSRR